MSDKETYQKCPICEGQGVVSRPAGIPVDQPTFTTGEAGPWECRACNGVGLFGPTPPPPSETPEMPGTLSKAQLYRLCCNLMLDLGLAAEYDPRMKGLRSVELRDLKPSEGHWPKPRPLTDKEIRAMVGKYFRNGGKHD